MSTNISKEKREQLIAKISEIKAFIEKSADDKNKSNLLSYMGDLQKELINKHYGLIFEEHRERIDEILSENLPVLTEEKDLFIDNGGQQNFLIEGDNLASLQLLEKTHRGKIDLIYIDPPYNTGNKDFIYDDNFVDSKDTFRHSKWCSFMQKRLELARKLLSEKGVIFISIDDNEQAALKMLCDDVFGEGNFVGQLIWQSTPGSNTDKELKTVTEYVSVYARNSNFFEVNDKPIEDFEKYINEDEYVEKRGRYVLNKLDRRMTGSHYSDALNYAIEMPDNSLLFPGCTKTKQEHWNWRWSKQKVEWGIKNGFIVMKQNGEKWVLYFKQYLKVDNSDNPIERSVPYQNLILENEAMNSARGTREVMDIFGAKRFDYPKPLSLITFILNLSTSPSSTILDFFAGSGTTGHAVLKLNAEDGGSRKFILCTNNENSICRDVTYERIKRVIQKENYAASLKYFRVEYIPITDRVYYDYADQLLEHTKELVELENAVNFTGNAQLAIILSEDELDSFCADKEKINRCKKIYLGHECATTAEQNELFVKQQISVIRIPNYYYKED